MGQPSLKLSHMKANSKSYRQLTYPPRLHSSSVCFQPFPTADAKVTGSSQGKLIGKQGF